MRLADSHPVAIPPLAKVKMEDRKRSLITDQDDVAPPSKRQATINGVPIKLEAEKEKEIEAFQKDAILRQMRELKRERNIFEAQVNELTKRSTHHDDHLRTVDAWFTQLLDEVRLLVNNLVPSPGTEAGSEEFQSSLLVQDNSTFEIHLKSRSGKIRSAITELFGKIPYTTPEVRELQERLAALLAAEKAHIVELQRTISERDQLSERLENATSRYLIAEKKLDRAKSATVQKLEQQAIMRSTADTESASKTAAKAEASTEVNGVVDPTVSAAAESARQEAVAIAEKRKLQVEQLEAENKRLTDELSTARTRTASLNDDDYAKTGLFTMIKSQHEGIIKRVNDLEATNVQLREQAQKLHAERTAYRNQVDEESRTATNDLESQLARSETDLARIRSARDELTAEIAIRNGTQDEKQLTANSTKELLTATNSRVAALESEVERLRLQLGDGESMAVENTILEELSSDELKVKLRDIEKNDRMLKEELSSMEAAWTRSQAIATRKVADIVNMEDQQSRVTSEKAKADQKYFAAMKAKEAREGELRALKAQTSKTSEIVTQLKDAESSARSLAINLEKQLSESKESLTSLTQQHRTLQQKISEGTIVSEGLKSEIAELKKLITAKDGTTSSASSARRQAEVELEECKVRLEETRKSLETMKKKGVSKESEASDSDWRRVAICPVCNQNLRNTVLKLCSHVFCNDCVQNLISHRSRKCPSCARAFGVNDSMPIILT